MGKIPLMHESRDSQDSFFDLCFAQIYGRLVAENSGESLDDRLMHEAHPESAPTPDEKYAWFYEKAREAAAYANSRRFQHLRREPTVFKPRQPDTEE